VKIENGLAFYYFVREEGEWVSKVRLTYEDNKITASGWSDRSILRSWRRHGIPNKDGKQVIMDDEVAFLEALVARDGDKERIVVVDRKKKAK